MTAVPPSLAFYWTDRANRAAVDILANNGTWSPGGDMPIEELEAFETARLAALRVRHDLWRFLREAWNTTWGSAMAAHLPRARLMSVAGHDLGEHGAYAPTLERGWEERVTHGIFQLTPNLVAFTGVRLEQDDRRITLLFSLLDKRTDGYPEDFALPAGWHSDDDGWEVADLHIERGVDHGFDLLPAVAVADQLAARVEEFVAGARAIAD